MYAINLCDWITTKDDIGLQILLSRLIANSPGIAECEPSCIDGGSAIILAVDNDQARAIIKIARTKYPKYRLRFYLKRGGGWKRT